MSRRRICVVTGSRAEYGLLRPLMKKIRQSSELELLVAVTGAHLSKKFGATHNLIEDDGFHIDARIPILSNDDSSVGVAKSTAAALEGLAKSFTRLRPDILVLLGDRYEILAAATAALVAKIPVAHICGGDTTEGAFDEAIRHSITKMSHLHFVTNHESASRVRQLGEDPDSIFNYGSLAIDQIQETPILDRPSFEKAARFKLRIKNLLITFHPPTLSVVKASEQFQQLLEALDRLDPEVGLMFTKPNADVSGRQLMTMTEDYVAGRNNAKLFDSLGGLYFSAVAHSDAVLGNSSSGLYEIPSFKKPTVNIGDRQEGRLRADSVINCPAQSDAIYRAIQEAFVMDCSATVNPYGEGNCAERICRKLREIKNPEWLLKKHFWEMP